MEPRIALPDTIAAIATAPGRGGIGIVRISGPAARTISSAVTGKTPLPRVATMSTFRSSDGTLIDSGITLFFPAPASFTGEDIVEFQCHGGPMVLDMIVEEVLSIGSRLARPGEFSERAYLNGKLDLAQAEAIADLIDSASREAARGAARSMSGEFSARVHALEDQLTHLRILVEAAIDFPEEDVDLIDDYNALARMSSLIDDIGAITDTARSGRLLRDGINVLIAGKPNAGKSSLLNALAGSSVAIVSSIPGTTRDLVRERILLHGVPVHVTDTAGLRDSPDEIEREGIRRALLEAESTDVLVLVLDSTTEDEPGRVLQEHFGALSTPMPPVCVVLNKCDLSGISPGRTNKTHKNTVAISALTGAGIDSLRGVLHEIVGFSPSEGGTFTARRRHLEGLSRARSALESARTNLNTKAGADLIAEDLRIAQRHLGDLTAPLSADDLLGKIFSSFCIGK